MKRHTKPHRAAISKILKIKDTAPPIIGLLYLFPIIKVKWKIIYFNKQAKIILGEVNNMGIRSCCRE